MLRIDLHILYQELHLANQVSVKLSIGSRDVTLGKEQSCYRSILMSDHNSDK